jgi:hypothetical protein
MTTINPYGLSQKDLDQYRRQKCITILEKITKSCFKMFRDPTTTKEQFVHRFFVLKKKLDQLGVVHLNAEYHTEMKAHIETLWNTLQGNFDLDKMREVQMTKLNRLQKLKNVSSYKKEKHRKWSSWLGSE